jgi:RNA polymerase-binding transcription factor DksA
MDTIRARLSARRDELAYRLRRVEAERRREPELLSADSADRAIQLENDDVIDSIGVATRSELEAIDGALHRLETGEYGICESCHYPIESNRLAAVPYAARCQRCAADAS